MEIIYKGDSIAGGGLSVLSMTKAEYLANQAVYDASDNIIEITDDDDLAISGEQIAFDNTGTGLSATDVQGAIEEVNDNPRVNDNARKSVPRLKTQIGTNDVPSITQLTLLISDCASNGLNGSFVCDFRESGQEIIRSTLFFSMINENYGAGILVSYYGDSFYKVKNANGTITMTPF